MKTLAEIKKLKCDAELAIAQIVHDLAKETDITNWEVEVKTQPLVCKNERGAVVSSKTISSTAKLSASL